MLYFNHSQRLFNNDCRKKYLYILEGPDACGKTTVAKEIQRATGYNIYHLTYFSDPEKMKAQYEWITNFIKYWLYDKGDIEGLIIDRLFLSNEVYQTVFQNGPIVEGEQDFLNFLINGQANCRVNADVTFINCMPSDKERWLNHFKKMKEEREELYTDLEKMSQVYDLYKKGFDTKYDDFFFMMGKENTKDYQVRALTFDLFHQMDMERDFTDNSIDMNEIIR